MLKLYNICCKYYNNNNNFQKNFRISGVCGDPDVHDLTPMCTSHVKRSFPTDPQKTFLKRKKKKRKKKGKRKEKRKEKKTILITPLAKSNSEMRK